MVQSEANYEAGFGSNNHMNFTFPPYSVWVERVDKRYCYQYTVRIDGKFIDIVDLPRDKDIGEVRIECLKVVLRHMKADIEQREKQAAECQNVIAWNERIGNVT